MKTTNQLNELIEALKDINDHAVKSAGGAHDMEPDAVVDIIAALSKSALDKVTRS